MIFLQIIHENKKFATSVNWKTKFMQILGAFYHQLISLLLSTDLLIHASEYTQVGLNYTQNYNF